jgi:hypothetical protein
MARRRGGTVVGTPLGVVRGGRRRGDVGWRARLRLWWLGRRDGRLGVPTPAAGDGPEERWVQPPAVLELACRAARSHEALRGALAAALAELDVPIAERAATVAWLAARVAASPAGSLIQAAEELGAPAGGDDAAARARRAAAKERAGLLADEARLAELRIRLAADLERRERLIDEADALAGVISSVRDQCIELYRAANLRRRRAGAAALAAAWPAPAFPPPAWPAAARRVPTGTLANGGPAG